MTTNSTPEVLDVFYVTADWHPEMERTEIAKFFTREDAAAHVATLDRIRWYNIRIEPRRESAAAQHPSQVRARGTQE